MNNRNIYLQKMLIHVFAEVIYERDFLLQFGRVVRLREDSFVEIFVHVSQLFPVLMQDHPCRVVIEDTSRVVRQVVA